MQHEFRVAINFIDEFSKHGYEFINDSFGSEQLGNLRQLKYRVQLRVRVLVVQVVNQKGNTTYVVQLIQIVTNQIVFLHALHFNY
jgi:hypothetical protein